MNLTQSPLISPATGRRSCSASCLGILIIGAIVLATVAGIGAAVLGIFLPNALSGIMAGLTGIKMPETRAVTGNAGAFDPIASYAAVSEFAGKEMQLVSIKATNVRSDGTLDLKATYSPAPRVDYQFVHEVPRPADAPPVGAGGTGIGPWYEKVTIEVYQPGARTHVTQRGGGISASYDYVNEGMLRQVDKPTTSLPGAIVTAPKCALDTLWKTALEYKASKDAVASIDYTAEGYSFRISALKVNLKFDADCRLKQ
jgi:hypothetical protein